MDLAQHVSLLSRSERSLRLRQVLQRTVREGDHVLDAGCGTGLLSIWSAKAGAGRVVGVDTSDLHTARELARENGVADRTEFFQGDLRDITLAGKFQIVMAMIYYNDLRRDEQQSRIAWSAYQRFLVEGGEPIPDSVRYTARGFAWPDWHISRYWREVNQRCQSLEATYDLKFDSLARGIRAHVTAKAFPPRRSDGRLQRDSAEPITEPTPFITIDYRRGEIDYPSRLALTAADRGRLDAVVWTQELMHRDVIIFSNESISWVDPPIELRPRQSCVLQIDDAWRRSNVMKAVIA